MPSHISSIPSLLPIGTIPGATVYYVQNIENVTIRTQAIAVNQSTEKRGEIFCKFCSNFKGWKCGSPEGGFAASYGDRYGLHSVWLFLQDIFMTENLILDSVTQIMSVHTILLADLYTWQGAADKGPLYGMGSGSWGAFEKSSLMRR
ncbi:uncharacterized protein LOC131249027 isoform X1 [Magnolia sinica]|uniref:uncharacterized protein LOC131249027 isoform X1 n=1 Tax=Magnolia sinica TaxID=86752 RepID=UPI002659EDBE|nr:uncharacterized protein LOC131249027 isoform X1 [Magnolia sinica]